VSYSFTVEAKDGVLTAGGQSGTIPDGKYSVSGHEDDTTHNLGVARFDEHGQQVLGASAYGRKT
jgi:hypothetical protein